jgi:hypothetical protein
MVSEKLEIIQKVKAIRKMGAAASCVGSCNK